MADTRTPAPGARMERLTAEREACLPRGEYNSHPDTTARIIHDLLTELDAVRRERDAAREERNALRELVCDFADEDACRHDHHGYCQTHLWLTTERECPHARAAKVLPPLEAR